MTTRDSPPVELLARIASLQTTVAALEKQIGRAGREQFKANALAETQAERLSTALEALQAAEARRSAELESAHIQAGARLAEARLDLARALLPIVDGLDEAIRAGKATLEHHSPREAPEALLRRLFGEEPLPARPTALIDALGAWLEGLVMVRRRLLATLAAEGVTPIAAEGLAFDPRRHIAVEVVPAAAAPGTVLAEVRRGFVAGERVLRHAEVAVAAEPQLKDSTV